MSNEFSDINLYFSERLKLFCMRFRKYVTKDFLGESLYTLQYIRFIQSHYDFVDTKADPTERQMVFSLTDRYFRYCVYRRRKFFDSKIWTFIISIATAIITAFITAYITSNITVQSILR